MVEVITQEHLDLAKRAGACGEGRTYRVGQQISEVDSNHLAWMESRFPAECREIASRLASSVAGVLFGAPPLSAFGYGSGSGCSGYGCSGYGGGGYGCYGYGDGSGDGN